MPPPAEGFAARLIVGPALRTQPDRRLVALVRGGYETAFEEIVRRYGKSLTRYAAAIVGGHAEDVTQDAFSKALLALRRDGKEIELRPWLFRIVRNTALNDLRDRPPSADALAEAIAGGRDPEEELERREELTDLMQRLQSLPEAQRAAIVMRELEGLSHDEIAAALGLSGGAARQAIFRARRALRDGAGMLLPLPLLKALLDGAATGPVEAAAGAAGVGGAAGAGVAIKATAATVLVAGAVGASVAIDNGRHAKQPEPARAGGIDHSGERGDDRHGGRGDDGHSGGGGDNRGPGAGGGEDPSASGGERGGRRGPSGHDGTDGGGDDAHRSGQSSGGSPGPGGGSSGGDNGGPANSSGPGPASTAPGGDSGSSSDSGSSDGSSPSSGSGSSGSGSGGEGGGDPSGSGDSGGGGGF